MNPKKEGRQEKCCCSFFNGKLKSHTHHTNSTKNEKTTPKIERKKMNGQMLTSTVHICVSVHR